MGFFELSTVIAAAWDTQLNPGDIRLLTASQLATAGHGELFFTERSKTQAGRRSSKQAVSLVLQALPSLVCSSKATPQFFGTVRPALQQ
ncbi:hypothetical protein VE26_06900 [Devosia chinhatensis]|uniref:Uncharacterized protein n=1 Tax=Devosia chinhatensis TaxID=429727 RepID=A0A0F5FL90_9HYPH|nr:hypothetical protein VE26_06900 [Devosia chinhatensis]